MTSLLNKELRRLVVDMTITGRDGHIPSAFSIIDIVSFLYKNVLKTTPKKPADPNRDFFILSKGHGCQALYATLYQNGFITRNDIDMFCKSGGILGEHPDCTKVPGVEASTGSLGHGLGLGIGVALGHKIKNMANMHYILVGDGECHEGTIWEAAHVAASHKLTQVCVIVDWNQSGMQLLPVDDLPAKWAAFGWRVRIMDGHDEANMKEAIEWAQIKTDQPTALIAKTIKGKGVKELEGHGRWHHKIPNDEEYALIMAALK